MKPIPIAGESWPENLENLLTMKRLETLLYVGANRRSKKTGIEHLLALSPGESAAIISRTRGFPVEFAGKLQAAGAGAATAEFLQPENRSSAACAFAHWFAASVVLLQQSAGHEVSQFHLIAGDRPDQYRAWYEYEHSEVARRAAQLALLYIARLIPQLELEEDLADPGEDDATLFSAFADFAATRVLPRDTQAIIDACTRLDIPCVKLDRDPYEGVSGDFRIRQHGMLKLGHSCYQHVVDGTVCVDRSESNSPLLVDRDAIFLRLTELDMPVAAQDPQFRNCTTPGRAVRSAARIGYPVVIKPNLRSRGRGVTLDVPDEQSLTIAVRDAQVISRRVIVERFIHGETWKLVIAGGKLTGVVAVTTGEDHIASTAPVFHEFAEKVSSALGFGMAVITVVSTDITQPLEQTGGAIVDLELAPELDNFLPRESALLDLAAERFVRWIYPGNSISRVPVISIGGTNGKTTTTRMVSRIMQAAGFHTGMAATDGVFINDILTEKGDLAGVPGHCRVLESSEVDCAVLETAMGSLVHTGLIFDWCNVAVCINVTADHLGNMGINTLQQLADLKRTALERARDAVVINADDPLCLGMVAGLAAKTICLASTELTVAGLEALQESDGCFCTLEDMAGMQHIVLYRHGNRIDVCAVNDIPATIEGQARFNTSNAQHAIAAAWLAGADLEAIRSAMGSFNMGFDETPGRLNIYDGLPFRVIMDYAHNPESMRQIGQFAARTNPEGRKIIMFAAPGDRVDGEIYEFARAAAGLFDCYYVRSYPRLRGRQPGEVSAMLKQALLEVGVAEEAVTELLMTESAVDQVLEEAQKGDLVILTASKKEFVSFWEKIRQFEKKAGQSA